MSVKNLTSRMYMYVNPTQVPFRSKTLSPIIWCVMQKLSVEVISDFFCYLQKSLIGS